MKVNVGFFGLLGIAFIVLKLCGVIDWDWFLVLAPLYLPVAVVVILALVFLFVAVLVTAIKEFWSDLS